MKPMMLALLSLLAFGGNAFAQANHATEPVPGDGGTLAVPQHAIRPSGAAPGGDRERSAEPPVCGFGWALRSDPGTPGLIGRRHV
jgi:hypothetical protein